MKFTISLILFSSIVHASSALHLAESESGSRFLIVDSQPHNISGSLGLVPLGICLKSSSCSKSYNMSQAFSTNLALSSGFLQIPDAQKDTYAFQPFPILVTSTPSSLNDNKVEIHASAMMGEMPAGEESFVIEKLPVQIDFDHKTPTASRRFEYSEAPKEDSHFSNSVFQIMGVIEQDGLGGSGASHGTGFFISSSGYALTNLHVMETNPLCLKKRSCLMTIKQKTDSVRTYELPTRVLTCSKLNDFCLIKLKLPSTLKIESLELGLSSISSKLLTLGYPGDKRKNFDPESDNSEEEVPLTYSYGSPVGLDGMAVSSNLFISGGASGSPIIDLEQGKVIGLNSNGAQTFAVGMDGMPAIFRPLYIIDREFDLKGYLNGAKISRIEALILRLQKTEDREEVETILSQIKAEKSFYGRSKLEVLTHNHNRPEIRRMIFKFLKAVESENL